MGQSFLGSLPDRAASRRATLGAGGGAHCLYSNTNQQEQEDSPSVVTGYINLL